MLKNQTIYCLRVNEKFEKDLEAALAATEGASFLRPGTCSLHPVHCASMVLSN